MSIRETLKNQLSFLSFMASAQARGASFEELLDAYLPENYNSSASSTDITLLEKGDLQHPKPIETKSKPSNGESVLEKEVNGWFSPREKRTKDFVERTRRERYGTKRYGFRYGFGRETYFTKSPDRRTFRRRKLKNPGRRSHIRNYRPEIPTHSGVHYLNGPDESGLADLVSLPYIYNGDLKTSPRYSRKFSNEAPQTMPKIPYREIPTLRKRDSRRRYMDLREPNVWIRVINPGDPRKDHNGKCQVWAYHSPKGMIGKSNLDYQGQSRPVLQAKRCF